MTARKYVDKYSTTRDELRLRLFLKQEGCCGICEEPLPKGFLYSRHVNLDHIRPLAHGGPDSVDNLQLTHLACNLEKGESCAGCEGCPPEV